uniref:Uncharacterized protein n=1 Tax=Palpitomonas bilix TaxID=652834 RepID=A0A7S3CX99_9EUKA|mmetsp:Transcript_11836/g.31961  ORF Transcript_11836/g.31961 Transcript_11836/m.31961 type:complete len:345 (+) Transcript_11836:607-1641(+)
MKLSPVYIGAGAAAATALLYYLTRDDGTRVKQQTVKNVRRAKKAGLKPVDTPEQLYEKVAKELEKDPEFRKEVKEKAIVVSDPKTKQSLWEKAKVWVKWGALTIGVVATGAALSYVYLRDPENGPPITEAPTPTEEGEKKQYARMGSGGSWWSWWGGGKKKAQATKKAGAPKMDPDLNPPTLTKEDGVMVLKGADQSSRIVVNGQGSQQQQGTFSLFVKASPGGDMHIGANGGIYKLNDKYWALIRLREGTPEIVYVEARDEEEVKRYEQQLQLGSSFAGYLGNTTDVSDGRVVFNGLQFKTVSTNNEEGWQTMSEKNHPLLARFIGGILAGFLTDGQRWSMDP